MLLSVLYGRPDALSWLPAANKPRALLPCRYPRYVLIWLVVSNLAISTLYTYAGPRPTPSSLSHTLSSLTHPPPAHTPSPPSCRHKDQGHPSTHASQGTPGRAAAWRACATRTMHLPGLHPCRSYASSPCDGCRLHVMVRCVGYRRACATRSSSSGWRPSRSRRQQRV